MDTNAIEDGFVTVIESAHDVKMVGRPSRADYAVVTLEVFAASTLDRQWIFQGEACDDSYLSNCRVPFEDKDASGTN